MGGIIGGGGGGAVNTSEPMALGMRIQTSAYGLPIPLVYGRTRVPGNLIWYGDFKATAHTTSTGGGKGGGGGGGTNTTYTYTAGIMLALGEGPIANVNNFWSDKNYIEGIGGFSKMLGAPGQQPWTHLTVNHPDEAVAYQGVAMVVNATRWLGSNSGLQNQTFDVSGMLSFNLGTIDDANPKDVVTDYLTNTKHGALFPVSKIGNWTQYSNYCVASGLFISPAYDKQQAAAEMLTATMSITNSGVYFSEGVLKITPFGDVAVTANGATYTPDTTPKYELTEDDFINEPLRVIRGSTADAFNHAQVEFMNRANEYNPEIAEAKDDANISVYGLRTMPPITAHEIADGAVARSVAQLKQQRSLYVRNTYEFYLSWKYCLLEPTDYVTLTDAEQGLVRKPVRITAIEENDTGLLFVTAEDAPPGVSSNALYPAQHGAGFAVNLNQSGGNTNAPVIFEPPDSLAATGLEVWIGACGGPLWGGCEVWVSEDDVTYKMVGRIENPARMGVLTAQLLTGSDPDVAHTLAVDLTQSLGELSGGTQADADNLNTLCFVDGELLSYQTATLTAANKYNLTYLRRGAYRSPVSTHAIGAKFLRIDDALFKLPFSADRIGSPLYVKLPSFNIWNAGAQSIADVSATTYTITGWSPPPDVTGFAIQSDGIGIAASWNEVNTGDLLDYEIRNGAVWETAAFVANVSGTQASLPALPVGAHTLHIRARDRLQNYSIASATASITISLPGTPSVSAAFVGIDSELTWANVAASYNIDRYEVRHGVTWGTSTYVGTVKGGKFNAPVSWLGSRTFLVAALDVNGNVGAAGSIVVNVVAPGTPGSMASSFTQAQATITWAAPSASLPIARYEIRRGADWAAGVQVGSGDARSFTIDVSWTDSATFWVKAFDTNGNESGTAASIVINTALPGTVAPASNFVGGDVVLAWNATTGGSLPIAEYEIRTGASWAVGTFVGKTPSLTLSVPVAWTGAKTFWIAAKDTAGNYGTAGSTSITVASYGAVTGLAAPLAQTDVMLNWTQASGGSLPVAYYEVRHGGVWSSAALVGRADTTRMTIPVDWTGARTLWVAAVDTNGNYGTETSIAVTINIPSAPSLSAAVVVAKAEMKWTVPTSSLPIVDYEIRHGASWAAGTVIATTKATAYRVPIDWTSSRTLWVAARDANGNVGTAASVAVVVDVPAAPVVSSAFQLDQMKLSWTEPVATLPVAEYEVRYGATWAGATLWGKVNSTALSTRANWSGAQSWWVAAIDVNGNVGTPASASVTVNVPSGPAISQQVIDNNVLLYWSGASGTLPIDTYEIRRGASWAVSTLIGTKSGGFTTVFETAAGIYTYWIAAIDTAGNYGTPSSVSATVSQPPDYVLKGDYNSTFSGTLSNAVIENGNELYLGVETLETYAQHFTRNSVVYSQVFNGGAWTGFNIAVSDNNATAPDGTTTACRMTDNATNSYHGIRPNAGAVQPGDTVAISFYAKQGTARYAWIGESAGAWDRVMFDLQTGTVVTALPQGSTVAAGIEAAAQGFYRCWIKFVVPVAQYSVTPFFAVATTSGVFDYAGSGSYIFIWGTQCEVGRTQPGPYVATTASAAVWTTPQAQVNAGYPNFLQPGAASAYYEETIDYGTLLAASKITVTTTGAAVGGSPTLSITISVKTNIGDAWTDYAGLTEVYVTNFRYIKVRVTKSGAGGVYRVDALNVRLDAKLKSDAGMAACVSTDAGGTTVNFNVPFVDITAIEVTPLGTTPVIPMYDFTDTPNPTGFKILLFNTAGARVSGTASWSVKGY